jgi:5-methylcytosine-specific restriction endonuclease McrA
VKKTEKRDDRCRGLSIKAVLSEIREEDREGCESEFSAIIKPMDNWNFAPVFYDKVQIEGNDDGVESHGYIPGEVYANAIWYYARPGDVVVEPMAGSGLIWKVWEDRRRWLRGWPELAGHDWSDEDLDAPLTLRTFDLNPRGPYADRIGQHDLSSGFPIDHADYIFMDVPYFAIVNGQYSTKGEDLANMDEGQSVFYLRSTPEYTKEVNALCQPCAHPRTELRRRVISNGQIRYGLQCLRCGDTVQAVPRANVQNVNQVPDYNPRIREAYREMRDRRLSEIREKYSRLQEAQRDQWWAWYNQYLKSPEWRQRRHLVMARAKGICEGCGIERAVHVHHLNYDRAGNEFLWDLVAVCNECHDRAHGRKVGV